MGAPAYPITEDNINKHLKSAQYAVRGEIVLQAQKLAADLKAGKELPFKKVVFCNVGNPQQLGQQPITFFRQVLALCDYPELLEDEKAKALFPADALQRAKEYLSNIPGGTGAYSESKGAPIVREHIAKGIAERDGVPCDPNDIFCTDGASPAVHRTLEMLTRSEDDAILTPIPQYPLYSASIALYGATLLPYYLDEDSKWGLDIAHLREQLNKGRSEGKCVRALVVINPGNPTGQVLSYDNQVDIVKFCQEEKLMLIADEVYQTNIYAEDKKFTSFKKIVRELEATCPLVSMNSTSKGFYGECGRRGGYFEMVNVGEDVAAQMYKVASISLCSNLSGQLTMAMVMNPPKEGDESYPLYAKERDSILESLKRRAVIMVDALNSLEGVSCNPTEGALYVIPRVTLPKAAVEEATKMGKSPDFLYCKLLLEEKGIVTVPGSGFKQREGSYHFRTTILPPEEDIKETAAQIAAFHKDFLKRYGGL